MSIKYSKTRLEYVFLVFAFLLGHSASGDDGVSRDAKDRFGTHGSVRFVVGFTNSNCSNCHSKQTSDSNAKLPPNLRGRGSDGWILGDEISTWFEHDFHYQAFSVLLNEQSKQMAKRLGIVDKQTEESLVHRDRRCLSCHSSVPVDQMVLDADRVVDKNNQNYDTTEDPLYNIGVSCEACHGPAGGQKGWEKEHVEPGWRTMNPKIKFENFGYWDIHSPRTQTRICLSCHMGNVEEQKVITHEMYAAGHPPLPSFELSQFIYQMPRHWRRIEEKPKSLRDNFIAGLDQISREEGFNVIGDTEIAATKMTMISALVTLEESMNLTADLIANQANSQQWPELANYSCFACHHELSRDGWRKKTRLSKFPGRPTLHEWPFALARVVAQEFPNLQSKSGFQSDVDAVIHAMTVRPYGDSTQLKLAATYLAKSIETETRRFHSTIIDRERAIRFLAQIAAEASKETTDYDSARQYVWAYERTFVGLNDSEPSNLTAATQEKPKTSQEWIGGHPILDEFGQDLVLWLRANRTNEPSVKLSSNKEAFELPQRSTNVSESLKKIAGYNPQKTSERFQRLLKTPVDRAEQTR
jgi:Cytochrome c554 and c-prime